MNRLRLLAVRRQDAAEWMNCEKARTLSRGNHIKEREFQRMAKQLDRFESETRASAPARDYSGYTFPTSSAIVPDTSSSSANCSSTDVSGPTFLSVSRAVQWLLSTNFMRSTCLFMLLMPMPGAAMSDLLPDPGAQVASTEPRTAKNSVFMEVGGSAVMLSINYDRILSEHFSLRAGIGGLVVEGDKELVFPILFNLLMGPASHKLEIGAGITLFFPRGFSDPVVPIAFAIGYRYAPIHTGLSFRIGATPFVFVTSHRELKSVIFVPWAGVSLGIQF